MTLGRVVTVVFAVALLAVVVPPAAAQQGDPFDFLLCGEEDPGTPRATIDCDIVGGGPGIQEVRCTLSGDVEWLRTVTAYQVPPGTCAFVRRFTSEGWYLSRNQELRGETGNEGIVAGYCYGGETSLDGDPQFLQCNVPATGRTGRVLLVVALALLGSLILWRRLA